MGSLFGALIARSIDRWWHELGRPDPYLVVDAGAGRGRLAADVLRAAPECAPALRYVLVERSAALRDAQLELVPLEPPDRALGPAVRSGPDEEPVPVEGVGPLVTALDDLPALPFEGVVIANELLDNLPFRVVEWQPDGWREVRVGVEADDLVEVVVSAAPDLADLAERVSAGAAPVPGARLPVPTGAAVWLERCAEVLTRGRLVVVDYAAGAEELLRRGADWLRTYRAHGRASSPLEDPGAHDITIDLPVEHLVDAASRAGFTLLEQTSQREWLSGLGLDELVDQARRDWDAKRTEGTLEAIAARSRVHEADALTDPSGLGAHHVFVFRRGRDG